MESSLFQDNVPSSDNEFVLVEAQERALDGSERETAAGSQPIEDEIAGLVHKTELAGDVLGLATQKNIGEYYDSMYETSEEDESSEDLDSASDGDGEVRENLLDVEGRWFGLSRNVTDIVGECLSWKT